jgi:hypothetical protein
VPTGPIAVATCRRVDTIGSDDDGGTQFYDKVPAQTYREIATQICGDDLKHPERWVLRRIYAGKFRAIKVGRSYRMTEEQLDEVLAALEIKPTTVTSPTPPSGLTRTSRRRYRRS